MEGIRDGYACDRCFVCGLLEPVEGDADCPRCERRMRWRPAAMTDPDALPRLVARYRAARDRDARRAALISLCEAVRDLGAGGPDALAAAGGPDLDELRRAWRALA